MAQEVVTRLVDDLDGSRATDTVRFGLAGQHYTIDLSAKNANKLRRTLAPFVESGRVVRGPAAGRTSTRRAERDFEPAVVRAWAAKRGIKLSSRGRIPGDVLARYKAARK